MDQTSKPGPSRKSDEELRLEHGIDRECRVVLSSAFGLEHGDSLAKPNKVFRVHYGHHYLWHIAKSYWDDRNASQEQKVDLDLLYDNFIDNRFSTMDRPLFKRTLKAYFGMFEENYMAFRKRRALKLKEALAELNAKRKKERYEQKMVKITYRDVIAIAQRKDVEKVKNAIRDNARVLLERQSVERMLADAQLTTAAASNSDPPAGTSDPPAGTSNSDPPAGTSKCDPPAGTSSSDPPASTSKCDPPPGTSKCDPPPGTSKCDPPAGTSKCDPPAGTSKCDPPPAASARGLKRKLVEDSSELPSRSMIGIENEENRRDPPAASSKCDPPAAADEGQSTAEVSNSDPPAGTTARGLKRKLVEDSSELPSQSMIGIENEENRPAIDGLIKDMITKVSDDCDDGTASNPDMSSAVPDDTVESPMEVE